MKRFAIKVALFTILLLICLYSTDYCVTRGWRKGSYSSWNDLLQSNIKSNVLILGNSRAQKHIDTAILDSILHINSYNLGINGYNIYMTETQYRIYKENNNSIPRLIILTTDETTVREADSKTYVYRLLPYHNDPIVKEELRKTGKLSGIFACFPIFAYFRNMQVVTDGLDWFIGISIESKQKPYKGYFALEETWNGELLKGVLSGDSIQANLEPEIIQLYDKFLNHCKQNGIKVIMQWPPEYYKSTEFIKDRDKLTGIYRSFSKKYDFPFLDYSTDSLCYDTTYFYNAMHLNKKGAEIFSAKLAHDIDSLGVLR